MGIFRPKGTGVLLNVDTELNRREAISLVAAISQLSRRDVRAAIDELGANSREDFYYRLAWATDSGIKSINVSDHARLQVLKVGDVDSDLEEVSLSEVEVLVCEYDINARNSAITLLR